MTEKQLHKQSKAQPGKENLKKELEKKDEIIANLKDAMQRLQAEFENYNKRCEKENTRLKEYAIESFMKDFLPILDSFELALKNTSDPENFKKGIELIYSQLYSMLTKNGLKAIDAENKKFDPYLHEVLLKEKSEKEDDTIIEELQKGYKFKEKVLRHSKVKVSEKC